MARVAVRRLALVVPPGRRAEAQARSEDALRLAGDGGDRLLIARRLDLGALPPGARPTAWQTRAERGLRALGDRAVHGGQPDAAASDAVWFRSRDEARALLLAQLARGIVPTGWFWRLAVPGWDGAPLRAWLPRLVATTRDDPPARVGIARALVRAVQRGDGAAVIAALADLPRAPAPARAGPISKPADLLRQPAAREAAREAGRIAARAYGPELARWLRDPRQPSSARRRLARLALIAAAPELLAREDRLAELAEALLADAVAREADEAAAAADVQSLALASTPGDDQGAATQHAAPGDEAAPCAAADLKVVAVPAAPEARASPTAEAAPATAAPALPNEVGLAVAPARTSGHAGLWLLVPSLQRMGLADWLETRPEPEFVWFGAALLERIATRQRAADDDPALAALRRGDADFAPWLEAWRIGLDRWLRRRARVRLADVVRRRGLVRIADDRVTVRFRPEDADIRLRRCALDLDPGWVSWLGLVVRYEYRSSDER